MNLPKTFIYAARSGAIALLAAAFSVLVTAPASAAAKIERLVTPGGIEVWLVRDATVPMIAIDFAFNGGSAQDPQDKPGVGNLAVSMLDEGAGELDSKAFNERRENFAIQMSFQITRDQVRGSVRTLTENRDEAFRLLQLALNAPRFDASSVDRVRAQALSRLQRGTTNPNEIASRAWWGTLFPDHPYGRATTGTLDSVPRIDVDDMKTYLVRVLARDTLRIAIVGDIDAASVATLVDSAFGPLPAKADLLPVAHVQPKGFGRRIVADVDVPQATVTFGGPGLARSDPDFMAGYIVNHILGAGSFTSRLYREIREKRGLAYGVSTSLFWLNHAEVTIGGTATRSDATGETIEIIEAETRLMAKEGPTEDELSKAKTYLKGSFALGLDTSSKIASQLVSMQLDNLGIDYIERRSAMIDAVTLADAKRVAKRLFEPGLLTVIAGRPQGVKSN